MPSFVPAYVFPTSASAALEPRSEEILERAAEFLWSDAMAESLEAFTENHKDMFVGATPDGEQRLEWTQAHIDFQQLFEHHLEQFVAQQDFAQEEFVAACQDALDHGGVGTTVSASIVEMVMSTATYEFFIQHMISAATADTASHGSASEDPGAELRAAAEEGRVEDVARLVAAGADVNGVNAFGATALHLAGEFNSVGVMELLAGADWRLEVRSDDGAETAMSLATGKARDVLAAWEADHGGPAPQPEPDPYD